MEIKHVDKAVTITGRIAWVALTLFVAIGSYNAYKDNYTTGYTAKNRALLEAARSKASVIVLDHRGKEIELMVSRKY